MTFYLVRHATTAWTGVRYSGWTDVPLDERGLLQARRLGEWFATRGLRDPAVISSPLDRARLTAGAIAQRLRVSVGLDERLREAHFGDIEGLTFAEVRERWPDLAVRMSAGEADVDWPGGETAKDVRERVAAFSRERLASSQRDIVVVSHGVTIAALCAKTLPDGPRRVVPPATVVVLKSGRIVTDGAATACAHAIDPGGYGACRICVDLRLCPDCAKTHLCFADCDARGCRQGGCVSLVRTASRP